MKKIFICSPLRGNVESNIIKARRYCREEVLKGNIPIAPHIYFTQFLDENNSEERELGIQLGIELLKQCDELHVYGSVISEGMQKEIKIWRELGRTEHLVFQNY